MATIRASHPAYVAGLILAAFTLAYPATLSGYATPFTIMLVVSFVVALIVIAISAIAWTVLRNMPGFPLVPTVFSP